MTDPDPQQQQQPPRTTGTATSRARLRRPAVRRPTLARLALSGPSGSGKTWTALSVAEVLAPGGRILVIDTERGDTDQGAAELYADQFRFDTIEWAPPYDPRDLAITLDDLSQLPEAERPQVVVVDSASHFWIGQGGTLDLADGRFGGWKAATPVQDEMVAAFLRCGFHLLVCTRARQDYAVEEQANGKQKVTKLGLAPVQRDALEYEFQVAITLDMDHRIDVGKTRAQPLAGGSWPAGQQARFALTYAEWLRAGVQLAPMADVDALRQVLRTAELGPNWAAASWPKVAQLDRDRLPDAWAWVALQLGLANHGFEPHADDPELCRWCDTNWRAQWHTDAEPEAEAVHDSDGATESTIAPADGPTPEPTADEMAKEEHPDAEPDDAEPDGPPPPLAITDDRTDAERAADGDVPPEATDARELAARHVAETLA